MMQYQMKIYLIDDHQMFAEAMKSSLEAADARLDITVFSNAHDALFQIRDHSPDLIILDLEMEGMTGTDLLKVLPQHGKRIPVLVCSGNISPVTIRDIAHAGAGGYLRKSESIQDVRKAIELVANGSAFPENFQPDNESGEANSTHPLSPRQQAILTLMKSGMNNSEIADALYLSPNTIKTHVRLMYNTLNVNSRIECLNKARTLSL
jgi:DNA-binding NarL/FixJ family response regulator